MELSAVPFDAIGAVERAGIAIGRLETTAERGGPAVEHALLLRQVIASAGGGEGSARALLIGDHAVRDRTLEAIHEALREPRAQTLGPDALLAALELAGVAPSGRSRDLLVEATADDLHAPPIVRAALAFGAVVSSAPATQETLRCASLAASLILTAAGVTTRSRVCPAQLDAATRSAAVQVERAGAWLEWIRSWTLLLAREAGIVERAVRATLERFTTEEAAARAQRRVGATDAQVLAHLHGVRTFAIRDAAPALGLSTPTVGTSIERLATAGVATELTGQQRDRVWVSTAVLRLASGHQVGRSRDPAPGGVVYPT